jgi:hypothetical protein
MPFGLEQLFAVLRAEFGSPIDDRCGFPRGNRQPTLRTAGLWNRGRLAAAIRFTRAARVESMPAFDRIERSSLNSARRAQLTRKFAPFRLDRDIVEDQFTFLARAVSCFRETRQIRLFDSPYFLNRPGMAFA